MTRVENTNFQTAAAYHKGEYASGNLLWEPMRNILVGGELLYGKRTDNGGATGEDIRTQLTLKASCSSDDLPRQKQGVGEGQRSAQLSSADPIHTMAFTSKLETDWRK